MPPSGECAAHGRPSDVEVFPKLPAIQPPAGWSLGQHVAIGGSAVVFEAKNALVAAPAILKWARSAGPDLQAQFGREAEVLAAVGPPATPALIEHGRVGERPYIIMERVSGETLAKWMARNGDRGGLGEILAILVRVLGGLAAVHRAGFVHADLKPENIVIGPGGARLLDFGVARTVRGAAERGAETGAFVGTVHYLAPEQIQGSAVDHRADLYAFGVVAFEMLTGRPPFTGERRSIEYQHRVVKPPRLRDARAVPDDLEALVLACLAKSVEGRPATADALREAIERVVPFDTIRGVGARRAGPDAAASPNQGQHQTIAVALVEGGDPLAVARAAGNWQGVIVRRRGDALAIAFTQDHEAPVAVAVEAARVLVRLRCRVCVHAIEALVRRAPSGKLAVYARELDDVDAWRPGVPFTGLVLTRAAGELVGAVPSELFGFYRDPRRDSTDSSDARDVPAFVGRDALLHDLVAAAASGAEASSGLLIGISGAAGIGKSRLLDTVVQRLRALGHRVAYVRGRRGLPGERPYDDPLHAALGTGAPIQVADDAGYFSAAARAQLAAAPGVKIVADRAALVEAAHDAATAHGAAVLAIELPPLGYADAAVLLREQLRPVALVPDVLIERLAIRGLGSPALLVALARDIKRRGSIRRHPGGDDWYVAADEVDTLVAPPGPEWLALRALEDLPAELAPILRACAALGPRFTAEEVAAAAACDDAEARLALLVQDGLVAADRDGYELADQALAEALYDSALDDRELIHARSLAHLLAHRGADTTAWMARIAHHAAGCAQLDTAAAAWVALARAAYRRGEGAVADALLARVARVTAARANPAIALVARTLGSGDG